MNRFKLIYLLIFCFVSISLFGQVNPECGSEIMYYYTGDLGFYPSSMSDGSEQNLYANNLHCIDTHIINNDPFIVLGLKFIEFDLGIGDTLRIYEGGMDCIFNSNVFEYTQDNPPPVDSIDTYILSGRIVTEFITNSEDVGQGWELEFFEILIGDYPSLNCQINNEEGLPIINATVNYLHDTLSLDCNTNSNGICGFNYFMTFNIPDSTLITPISPNDYVNGVTALDLIKIQKHILGIEIFDSNYKLIAADVNRSGNITALDIIAIQKLILGISSEFDNNPSWRFVHTCDSFENGIIENEEDLKIDSVNSKHQIEFIGIKIGDVNNTAVLILN